MRLFSRPKLSFAPRRRPMSRRARFLACCSVLTVILVPVVMAACAWASITRESTVDTAAPSDAVVVLGCKVMQGGHPSPELRARTQQGIRVWKETHSRFLVVSGGLGDNAPAEATVMRQLAEKQGVPPDAIIDDPYAYRTADSAVMCARIAHRLGWHRVTIVSDPWHLARSRRLFTVAGMTDVRQSPALDSPAWTDSDKRTKYMMRETISYLYYTLTGRA